MSDNDAKELLAMLDSTVPEDAEEILKAKGIAIDVPRSEKRTPRSDVAASVYTKKWPKNHRQKKMARKRAKQSRRKNR